MRQLKDQIKSLFSAMICVGSTETALGRAKLQTQYETLKRKIPVLHLIVLVNAVSIGTAHGFEASHALTISLPGILTAVAALRFLHWMRNWDVQPEPEGVERELKRTLIFTVVLCLGFSGWGLAMFEHGDAMHKAFTAIFIYMSSIGSAYCLGSLPKAARATIFLVGLPIAVRLILSGHPLLVAMGFNLSFISLITLHMLGGYYASLIGLIESREEVIAEKTRAQKISLTDALTGLTNRRALTAAIDQRICSTETKHFAVAILDLDGFKPINDTYGHAAGDEVLKIVASRLNDLCAGHGLVGRLGGDEFVMVLDDVSDELGCRQIGNRICEAICEPIRVAGMSIRISACCGFALYPECGADCNLLIDRADTALYHCKRTKSEPVALFRMDFEKHLRRRMKVQQSLRAAVSTSMIDMVFQPIFDLQSGELSSFEALARWHDPQIGQVSPLEFITTAEQIGIITELTNRLLEKALTAAGNWDERISLSFNISAVQISDPATGMKILAALNEKGIAPDRFNIEITETALLTDFESARSALRALRAAGVRIYIDDFGTGQSSLEYLRAFEFDVVKVDQSFIQSIRGPAEEQRLIRGIRELCAAIDVPCIAEGIETDHQKAVLRELGFQYGQGNGLSRPVSAEEAAGLSNRQAEPRLGRLRSAGER